MSDLSGFKAKFPAGHTFPKSRTATNERWQNLIALYHQIILYFETNVAQPTVEFSVLDLYSITKKDNDHDAWQAIVCMNALVLKVYTHIPEGLKIFRQLSEAEETTLEKDILGPLPPRSMRWRGLVHLQPPITLLATVVSSLRASRQGGMHFEGTLKAKDNAIRAGWMPAPSVGLVPTFSLDDMDPNCTHGAVLLMALAKDPEKKREHETLHLNYVCHPQHSGNENHALKAALCPLCAQSCSHGCCGSPHSELCPNPAPVGTSDMTPVHDHACSAAATENILLELLAVLGARAGRRVARGEAAAEEVGVVGAHHAPRSPLSSFYLHLCPHFLTPALTYPPTYVLPMLGT
ncbi:hypothetical protein B0H13DRAFT_1898183 [Mycena leptocephala]|nr:hypothetical protein B0H13DRAFT_1898183 [Mycena leptocephala]